MRRAWFAWIDLLTAHYPLACAVVAAVVAIGAFGVGRVSFDDDPIAIIRSDSAEFKLLEEVGEQFNTDENDVVVVIEGDDVMSRESLAVVRQLTARFAEVDGVESVFGVLSARQIGQRVIPLIPGPNSKPERFETAKQLALEHPLVAGQLLSPDCKTMAILVRLAGSGLSVSQVGVVLDRLHEAIDTTLHAEPNAGGGEPEHVPGLRARLAGHAAVRVDNLTTLQREQFKFAALAAVVSATLGMIMLHRAAATAIVACSASVGVFWTVGWMGFAGARINGLNTILPTLVFVIGFSDAVHLMMHIQRTLVGGASRVQAAASAMRQLGGASLLCAVTAAIGFGSLVMAQTPSVQRFGLLAAVGCMISFAATVTVLPLLAMTRLGKYVVPHRGRLSREVDVSRWWPVQMAMRYPWPTWIAGALVSAACFWSARNLKSDIQWTEAIPPESETAQAMRSCDQAFGGAALAYVLVDWPAGGGLQSETLYRLLGDVHTAVDDEPLLRGSLSVANLLHAVSGSKENLSQQTHRLNDAPPRVQRRLVRPDLQRLLVAFHVPDVGAAAIEPALASLEENLGTIRERYPGYRLRLTGTTVVASQSMQHVISDLARSVGASAVVIFGVLWLGFKSFRLAVISCLPDAFPLTVTAAYLVLTGRPLQITSAMTFSLCLGLAVNDTLHFLHRFQHEQHSGLPKRDAVQHALRMVGAAMVASTVILVGGFACMLVSSMPAIRLFAELSCVTMAAAMVGDLVILPALVLCFAKETPRGAAPRPVVLSREAEPSAAV